MEPYKGWRDGSSSQCWVQSPATTQWLTAIYKGIWCPLLASRCTCSQTFYTLHKYIFKNYLRQTVCMMLALSLSVQGHWWVSPQSSSSAFLLLMKMASDDHCWVLLLPSGLQNDITLFLLHYLFKYFIKKKSPSAIASQQELHWQRGTHVRAIHCPSD